MSRPIPAGKFVGIDTLELLSVEPVPRSKAPRTRSAPAVAHVQCPGCRRGRGVVEDGDHRRIREHLHPTTHVPCSRSGALVHDVFEQWTKQPAAQRCGCYRG